MADIFGVRVTPELDTLNSLIICNSPAAQTDPSVAFDGTNYLVVWSDAIYDGAVAARITPQGAVLDAGNYIGGDSGFSESSPDIACGFQRSLAVWSQEFYGVCGRFVNSSAQPEDKVITIATTLATSTSPKIEFDSNNYFVIWTDFCSTSTGLNIYGQIVSPQGNLIGAKIAVAEDSATQSYPDLVFNGASFLVVWVEESSDIYGQLVSTSGQLQGSKFRISDSTSYNRNEPAIGAGLDNYLVVWGEYHDAFDVYGNADIAIGIAEEISPKVNGFVPSIITGPLILSSFQKYEVYDVTGRRVDPYRLTPGVYFVSIEDRVIERVVKIR